MGSRPCWLHNNATTQLGRDPTGWGWRHTRKSLRRVVSLKDIVEDAPVFDKDNVLRIVPERHQAKLCAHDTMYATGYHRTRNGIQQLELHSEKAAKEERWNTVYRHGIATSCGGAALLNSAGRFF